MIVKSFPGSRSWTAIALLVIIALIYCSAAIAAPFWGNNDTWSNLLPIIHYRKSILEQHVLPLNTDLWFGGRAQWQNPLWSFPYFPATLVWLSVPLDWGARIVFTGHLIFALLAGWKLSTLFLSEEAGRVATAIILTAPMLAALAPGHIETVMAWGWLLLALYFLLNEKFSPAVRGAGAGICWGIVALTGANYHVLYAGILLVPLAFSYQNPRLLVFFVGGSLIGLIHLPTVWHLIGVSRGNPTQSIVEWSIDLRGILTALSFGPAYTMNWETWAPVGVPIVYLFFRFLVLDTRQSLVTHTLAFTRRQIVLLLTLIILILLATGALYQGQHLLDTFRTSGRAISVIALTTMLYVLISHTVSAKTDTPRSRKFYRWLLVIAAVQVGLVSWLIRPPGSQYNLDNSDAQQLIQILQADQAKSVWMQMEGLQYMYIQAALTEHNVALPNVYYGDMGQIIPVRGPYCGFSFDHLISPASNTVPVLEYIAGVKTNEQIPATTLQRIAQVTLHADLYDIYRVVCSP